LDPVTDLHFFSRVVAAVPDITQILHAAAAGDARATEELLPLLYQELRSLAEAQMAKLPPGNTLQPTAVDYRNSRPVALR